MVDMRACVYVCCVYDVHRQSVDTRFRRGEETSGPIDFHRVSKFCMHVSRELTSYHIGTCFLLPCHLAMMSLVNSDWIYFYLVTAFDQSPGIEISFLSPAFGTAIY